MGNYARYRATILAGGRAAVPPPVANFSADDTTVDNATVVTFTDSSTGTPTAWSWNFGDGTSSTLQNPTKTYETPGTYTVTLTASNAGGSDDEVKSNYIVVSSFLAAQTGYDSEWDAAFAYTDTGRTTLASVNDDLVAAMADRGSNGRHVTQSTSGNRPTFVTVGGKPAVKFLSTASKTLANTNFFDASWNTAYTLYLVWEYHGRGGPLVAVGGNSTNNFIAGDIDGGTALRFDWYTGGNGSRYHNWLGKNRMVACLTYDGTTKRVVIRGHTGVTDDDVSSAMTANLGMSGNITFGDLSQGAGFACPFFLHHAVLYKSGHNSTVRGNILTHLKNRWLTEPAAGTPSSGQGNVKVYCDGDSLTVGTGSTGGNSYPEQMVALLGSSYDITNLGVGAQTVGQMNADAETQIDALFSGTPRHNVVVCWGGTNDLYYGLDAATALRRVRDYCLRRRAAGFKVIVVSMLPRSDGGGTANFLTRRATFNTALRADWTGFADALVDVGANTDIGEDGDQTNGTYYSGDNVHLGNAGYTIVAEAVADAILTVAPLF